MRIQVFPGKDGWHYRVRSINGQILLVSESYTRRASALRAARRFKYAISEARIEWDPR